MDIRNGLKKVKKNIRQALSPTSHKNDPTTQTTLSQTHSVEVTGLPKSEEPGRSRANLATFLGVLNQMGATEVFTPLRLVIENVTQFIDAHEDAVIGQKEYRLLRRQLEGLIDDLCQYFSGDAPPVMTTSILNLCSAIQAELEQFSSKQSRRFKGILSDLHTWKVLDELKTEARLNRMEPTMSACYNSAEAMITRRRECTIKTREQVLLDLHGWKRDAHGTRLCWMSGMAGTGKTTIANTLCTALDKSHELGASFFCTRLLPECRNIKKVIPTISYQLARFSRPFRGALSHILEQDPDIHTKVLRVQFERMIVGPLREVSSSFPTNVVAVIDALDECEDKDGVDQILGVLLDHASALPIKFFVSSRPEYYIRHRLAGSTVKSQITLHELDEKIVKDDIETYLREELACMALSDSQLAALVEKAGVLFIYAATAVRYIGAGNFSMGPKKRLETVLGVKGQESLNKTKEVDALYEVVLASALENSDLEPLEREEMELVLHTVVCAQEPLTAIALAGLLQLDDVDQVRAALQPLWSVLHISESDTTDRVSVLHASFPDYMLDPNRSKRFSCDLEVHNGKLAELCFRRIERNVCQFNICQLESSFIFDRDVLDIDKKVEQSIPLDLFYAGQYWAIHLELGGISNNRVNMLYNFLSHRLLLWMEVLNLKNRMHVGAGMLERAKDWLTRSSCAHKVLMLAHDAWRFTTMFATSPIAKSTPHIYVSMLAFWPDSQPVAYYFLTRAIGLVNVHGLNETSRQLALLTVLPVGTGSSVYGVAFSPDGALIAAGTSDNTILVWDAQSCRLTIDPIRGHTAPVQTISISPDGAYICSGSRDGTICIWNIHDGGLVKGPFEHAGWVYSVDYSPDGLWIASGSADETVCIWSTKDGQMKGDPLGRHESGAFSVAFSPKGTILACGSMLRIYLWDTSTGKLIGDPLEGHNHAILAIQFSPNGKFLASGSEDDTLRIWDMDNRQNVFGPLHEHLYCISSIKFSHNGALAASGSADCTVRIWDTKTWKPLLILWHTDCVEAIAFSPSGSRLISGSQDNSIRMWEVAIPDSQIKGNQSVGHSDWVRSVVFSPCGSYVISGSDDKTICIWDVPTGRLVQDPLVGHDLRILSVGVSADNRIVSGSQDRTIREWDIDGGAIRNVIGPLEGHWFVDESWPVAFSPDGTRIVSSSDRGGIFMWAAGSDELLFESTGHEDGISSLAFSPDGRLIASGSWDKRVLLWDANGEGKLFDSEMEHSDRVCAVSFSPDGSRVASGSDDMTIRMWNTLDGKSIGGPLRGHAGAVNSVAFSPDGAWLASGSKDRNVCVWDVKNERLVAMLGGHTSSICSVAFSPDGTQIASGSGDMTVRLWNSPTERQLHQSREEQPEKYTHTVEDVSSLDLDWEMDDDGWVHDNQRILLWVPPDLRSVLLRPQNTMLISRQGCVKLDFTSARIGESWITCYQPSSSSSEI
ncbi:hypothetical protein OPQ81_010451 [Rhizoctonia solani]|nr:hypothetical protein OPQ81_010451 [Rhizoctonia solani]